MLSIGGTYWYAIVEIPVQIKLSTKTLKMVMERPLNNFIYFEDGVWTDRRD